MIDTHCHLDATRFNVDRAQVLERAWAAGVTGILVPAVGPTDWEALLAVPREEPRVQVGLGIHPQLLPHLPASEDDAQLERLDALLTAGGAIAVGECGLDDGSLPGAPLERQLLVVRRHLALARKHQLPVLMHCLKAHPAMMQLLEEEVWPEAGLVMHSYSGGAELARFYIKKGCHFSFAGPVTYAQARKPLDALRAIPIERLMVETDSPDQAPHPHRGSRSEPGYLPLIVDAIARALGRSPEEISRQTTANVRALFPGRFPLQPLMPSD